MQTTIILRRQFTFLSLSFPLPLITFPAFLNTLHPLFFLNSPLSVIFLFTYCYSRNFLIAITSSLHIPLNFHPTIVFSVYHCLVFGNFGFRFLQTIQQRFKVVATIPKYLRRDLPRKNISSAGNSPN